MPEVKDGGHAFPQTYRVTHPEGRAFAIKEPIAEGGMSLRDYFAAQALPGIVMNANALAKTNGGTITNITADVLAEAAYNVADAMIARRETEQP